MDFEYGWCARGCAAWRIEGLSCVCKRLRTQTIYDAVKSAKPASEVVRFAFPEIVWRHFERLNSFPRGLLPFGDVICRFNPIYGQGMSVAAKEACVLRDLFAVRSLERDPLEGLAQSFFAAIQEVLDTPGRVLPFRILYFQRPAATALPILRIR